MTTHTTWAAAMAAFGPLLTLRATVLLAGALALAVLLRRSSGSARHALWTVSLIALLALPALTPVVPAFSLPVPGWTAAEPPADASAVEVAAAAPLARASAALGDVAEPTSAAKEGLEHPAREANLMSAGGPVAGEASSPLGTRGGSPPWWLLAAALWGAGALLGGAALGSSLARAHGVFRDARPVEDPSWHLTFELAKARVGLDRPVQLCVSGAVRTPMAGGLRAPVVLLPEGASKWSAERRWVVLLHELVHVKRHDPLRQVLSRLATSVYWFHPLAWVAYRMSLLAREQACDEAVVELGCRPSTYARHLLDLSGPEALPWPALARLERPQLEERLRALLSPAARAVRPGTVGAAALVAALWAAAVAGATPAPAQSSPHPAAGQALATAEDGGGTTVGDEARDAASASVGDATDRAGSATGLASRAPRNAVASDAPPTPGGGTGDTLARDGAAASRQAGPSATLATWSAAALRSTACFVDGTGSDFSGTLSIRDSGGEQRVVQRFGYSNGVRVIQTHAAGATLCLRGSEQVDLGPGGLDARSMRAGDVIVMAASANGRVLELRLEGADGRARFLLDGEEREVGPVVAEWRHAMERVLGGHWAMSRIRGEVSSLRGEISSARGRVSSLRGEISSIRGHVSSLRGEISSARGRVSSLRGEISSARGHVSSLRGKISSMRGHVSSLNGQISSLRGQISGLESARRSTRDPVTRDRLDREIDGIERAIRGVQAEIAAYDIESRVAAVEREIEEYGLERRVAEIEQRIDAYDVERRVADIEREIEAYDAESRIAQIERRIEELGTERLVADIERQIDRLDAEERVRAIAERIEPEERRLRELIQQLTTPTRAPDGAGA